MLLTHARMYFTLDVEYISVEIIRSMLTISLYTHARDRLTVHAPFIDSPFREIVFEIGHF